MRFNEQCSSYLRWRRRCCARCCLKLCMAVQKHHLWLPVSSLSVTWSSMESFGVQHVNRDLDTDPPLFTSGIELHRGGGSGSPGRSTSMTDPTPFSFGNRPKNRPKIDHFWGNFWQVWVCPNVNHPKCVKKLIFGWGGLDTEGGEAQLGGTKRYPDPPKRLISPFGTLHGKFWAFWQSFARKVPKMTLLAAFGGEILLLALRFAPGLIW